MSYNQSQNHDNISSASIISNYDKPDLDSKYDNLNKTLKDLRKSVKDITTSSNKDSNEKSNYESLEFIKEVWNKCTAKSAEIFAITNDLYLGKTVEVLIKVLVNQIDNNKFDKELKDWNNFEVPEEIYDEEFNLINIPYVSQDLLDVYKSKQRKFFKNLEKVLKVPMYLFQNRIFLLLWKYIKMIN